jgi:hypothetical protein
MKVVKVRSPFVIEVSETGQQGSKIELFIWRNGDTIPTTPTYTLSKPIPTSAQIQTYYNVSNLVKEYIDNIAPNYPNWVGWDYQENYAMFRVKRYKNVSGTYTLLDTKDYVGVNGFTNYMDGLQNPSNTQIELLFNKDIINTYHKSYKDDIIQYVNVLVDFQSTADLFNVTYSTITGTLYTASINNIGLTGIYLFKVPLSLDRVDTHFAKGCKVSLTFTPDGGSPVNKEFYSYPIEECKYEPILCDFINSYGGWQTLTLYKARTNNLQVKKELYKLTPDNVNYTALRGQSKSFNHTGKKMIKVNSGFVYENYSELINDLLLSETILLDRKPVIMKTEASELKYNLKDKLINYELDFEYAFNVINDAI